jgi:uncharacterized membrane protein
MFLKLARRRWMWAHGHGHGGGCAHGHGHGGGCGHGHGHDGGWHRGFHRHGGWGGHHGWHGHHRGDAISMAAWELRLTEEQEAAVRQAVRELRGAAMDARPELARTREDLAKAFRADSLDAELLGHTFARHDEELERFRRTVIGALAKAHAVLDERQRGRLADLIAAGRGFDGAGFGPYR